MYENLLVFRSAGALAQHAAGAQKITAANIANADTPGFRARQAKPFSLNMAGGQPALLMTRKAHLRLAPNQIALKPSESNSEPSPNGNTVSLEEQLVRAAEAQSQHTRALAIYRHGMTVLRATLGR